MPLRSRGQTQRPDWRRFDARFAQPFTAPAVRPVMNWRLANR